MGVRVDSVVSASHDLTTTYSVKEIDGLPDECRLGWLHGPISSDDDTSTEVIFFLAKDAAGNIPITDEITASIVKRAGAVGGVNLRLDIPFKLLTNGVAGKVFVVAKLDADTLTIDGWELTYEGL